MYTAPHITRHKHILFGLLGAVCLLVGLYVYFVNVTVHNVVARRELEEQMVVIATTVSQLESEYITLKSEVTLDVAASRGFAQADVEQFVSRSAPRVTQR